MVAGNFFINSSAQIGSSSPVEGEGKRKQTFRKRGEHKCYALGSLELFDDIFDIDKVSMTIYQPRRQNVSTYEIRPVPLGGRSAETHCGACLRRRRELPLR